MFPLSALIGACRHLIDQISLTQTNFILSSLQAVVFYTKQSAGLPKEIQGTVLWVMWNSCVYFLSTDQSSRRQFWSVDLIMQWVAEIPEVNRCIELSFLDEETCLFCVSYHHFLLKNLSCHWQDSLTVVVEDLRLCSVKPCEDNERRFCFEVVSPTK